MEDIIIWSRVGLRVCKKSRKKLLRDWKSWCVSSIKHKMMGVLALGWIEGNKSIRKSKGPWKASLKGILWEKGRLGDVLEERWQSTLFHQMFPSQSSLSTNVSTPQNYTMLDSTCY